MRFLQQLAISLFGIIFALALFEIAFRLMGRFASKPQVWDDRPKFYYKHELSETIQTAPYQKIKPANNFRIAVVGDSYSFAPYMQYSDTFVAKLQEMLNQNDTPIKAEVVNYGVPAYSTSHEVPVTTRAIDEGADLVLLQITLNDPELKPYTPEGITTNQPDRWAIKKLDDVKHSILKHWKSMSYVLTRIHNSQTHKAYTKYFIDLFETPKNWNAFQKAFQSIKEECKSRNIKLVAVVFPLFGLPLDENYPFKVLHEKLDRFLTDQSVDHLDLYNPYQGIPLQRMQVIPEGDRHPNEIAHRMAAEAIYTWLEQRSIIPQDLKIRFKYNERMGISGRGLIH